MVEEFRVLPNEGRQTDLVVTPHGHIGHHMFYRIVVQQVFSTLFLTQMGSGGGDAWFWERHGMMDTLQSTLDHI